MQYQLETDNMDAYLASDEYMDWQGDADILEKAKALCEGCDNDLDKIAAAFVYVRDLIPHSGDIQGVEVAETASDCLVNGHALCYVKSMLLAAILRSQGIPTGLCYQRLARANDHILHGLNAVYLKDRNKWVRIDARGNLPGKEAAFDVENPEKEQLVFLVRPEAGEVDYPTIYAVTPQCISDCLQEYSDARELLKQGLPAEL